MNFNMLLRCKTHLLSWLLHHANRNCRQDQFYQIKKQLLTKYGTHIGYDVQFIDGVKCNACNGKGIYTRYFFRGESLYKERQQCYHCAGGWYKRPVWNILQRLKFGNYIFHQPFQRSYTKPADIKIPVIEGYIEHTRSRYGLIALTILFFTYEKGYSKRWRNDFDTGGGWPIYWWWVRNWLAVIVHVLKKKKKSQPYKKLQQFLSKFYNKPVFAEKHQLPF